MPIKGDFISFTYNSVHSTDLGIVHVSSSDRYADALLPTFQDKTVQATGSDGTYFFGSYYTQRPITLNIAFDSMTEEQFRLARKVFGDKQSHPLIFDEEPYKVYYAKVTGTPQYNYICFGSPRIYKGEGTINFICYDPFAHCPNQYKYLDQWLINGEYYQVDITIVQYTGHETDYYILSENQYIQCTSEDQYDNTKIYYKLWSNGPDWYKYDNKNEWNLSANLLTTKGTGQNAYDTFLNRSFKLYNPGDVEVDFKLIVPISAIFSGIKIDDGRNDLESHTLNFNAKPLSVPVKGEDTHLLFNSKTNLVEGLKIDGTTVTRTGNLYNEKIGDGHWFRIPLNQENKTWYFTLNDYSGTAPILEYDYLYF